MRVKQKRSIIIQLHLVDQNARCSTTYYYCCSILLVKIRNLSAPRSVFARLEMDLRTEGLKKK